MSQIYRIAMIGCGRRAREHATALKADGRCEIVALSDLNRAAAEQMNEDFEFGAAIYDDFHEMLGEVRPDVVVACLWTGLHRPVFEACVDAGVRGYLSEKPMASTWGDCLAMAELAEASGCQLTFCHQRRFAPGNQMARRLIEEGLFGDIQRMDMYSPPNLLDCGTHTFDQALSFNRETPARWVLGAVDASKPLNWFGVSAENQAVGTIVFENGVRGSLQVGGPDMDMGSGVRVIGSKGFLEVTWDGDFRHGVVYADPSWTPPEIAKVPGEQMAGVVKNALDCLESGDEPELSWRKALRASEIIFSLYESVRSRSRVMLPLTGVLDNPFLALLEGGAFATKEENAGI